EDFHQVSQTVHMLMLQSPVDRPDLARILLKQRLIFAWAMISMECRLTLYGFGVLFARLILWNRMITPPENLDAICSPARYAAMDRFLQGGDPNLDTQLRKERIEIFRGYVHQIADDFHQVSKAVKLMILQSSVDRPDLARILLKQRLVFAYAMMAMEVRLAMYGLGMNGTEVRLVTGSLYAL